MLHHPEIEKFGRVADLLAMRGWAEANAGNLSVRIDSGDAPSIPVEPEILPLEHHFLALDGQFFFVTATGSRARDVKISPESTIGLIEIIDDGRAYKCHWGAYPPTSEFPAHMAIHQMCLESRPEMKAVLHTHPPNLIALSHHPGMQEPGKINMALRMMHPEVGILVPDGIASMHYRIPGTYDLGMATRDALKFCNITFWPMHGVVSLAPDLYTALDQIEILEKAAMIYLMVLAAGVEPVGLSMEQLKESREYWGIKGGLE